MSVVNPGRVAAARALLAVERGAHVEDLLARTAPKEGPDRRLAWNLALGVLRRQGSLDVAISAASGRTIAAIDPPALVSLRIGLYELHLTRSPVHAAVDQAVECCRALGGERAAGFVNAVMRKASRQTLPQDPWLDLPPWLVTRWRGNLDGWVARLNEAPPVCGVWRDAADPVVELETRPARAGGAEVPGAFALTELTGPVERLPGFAEGRWWVMDPAAAAVADLAGVGPGMRVLDACAAPGGKSLRLAAAGARVLAVDQSADRLALVTEAAKRTGLPVETRQHDWLSGPLPGGERFDVVLVDAPCSGLGTLRRHPEIRWRRQPTDPAAMALRQRPLLAAAAAHVVDGGRLLYAVCSPMLEEGPPVAQSLTGWQVAQTWSSVPPQDDEDAFQAFLLRRTPPPPRA